jgi:GNAT superfamily N-acetyltransferase
LLRPVRSPQEPLAGPMCVGETAAMVRTRLATPADRAFLACMLVQAADWRPDAGPRTVDEVLADPALARYVDGWQRPDDVGVIALDSQDQPVGATWWRYFPTSDPGFGFVSPSIPEVSLAVEPARRGQGVGRLLLATLISHAREHGVEKLSLSVEHDNPAQLLYTRLGFAECGRNGRSVTMVVTTVGA